MTFCAHTKRISVLRLGEHAAEIIYLETVNSQTLLDITNWKLRYKLYVVE